MKDKADTFEMANDIKKQDIDSLRETNEKLRKALEEIKNDIMTNKSVCTECIKIAKRINEVLNDKEL